MSMKQTLLVAAVVLMTGAIAVPLTRAFPIPGLNPGGNSNSGGEPSPQTKPASQQLSGKFSEYVDSYNGYKLKVPVEFQRGDRGATTTWQGPLMDGGSASMYINAAPMKGVPSQTVYEINLKSKKEDRNYTEVVPVKVKFGNKTVPAFRCKESNRRPGSPDMKSPEDIHRWHLFVFGNEMVYTMGFAGPFASFQANKLQTTYDPVIQSVELVPIQ